MSQDGVVYIRCLFSRGHGCALFVPEPNDDLPPECVRTGNQVGDVGLITTDGQFVFLFNICHAEDHPINQYNGVPPGFKPLSWDGKCVHRKKFFRAQQPISSRNSAQFDLSLEGNASIFGLPVQAGGGVGIQFSREKGAVVMPGMEGADRTDASNKAIFRNYAYEHGESWYQFVNETLGREAENGELYLITGFDKTNSWENAVVHNSSTTKSCSVAFTTGGLGAEARLRLSKTTGHEALLTSRCSSDETYHNQSLFVRGFRISIRQGVLGLLGSRTRIASTYKSSLHDVLDRLPGGVPFGGSSASSSRLSGGGWSLSGSYSSRTTPTSSVYDSDSDSDSCSVSSDESSTSIEEDDFVPESRLDHPLVAINDHILLTRKDAKIVVTHDDDWISLLNDEQDGNDMPDDSTLIARLEEKMTITVNEHGHAAVNEIALSAGLIGVTTPLPLSIYRETTSPQSIGSSSITDFSMQSAGLTGVTMPLPFSMYCETISRQSIGSSGHLTSLSAEQSRANSRKQSRRRGRMISEIFGPHRTDAILGDADDAIPPLSSAHFSSPFYTRQMNINDYESDWRNLQEDVRQHNHYSNFPPVPTLNDLPIALSRSVPPTLEAEDNSSFWDRIGRHAPNTIRDRLCALPMGPCLPPSPPSHDLAEYSLSEELFCRVPSAKSNYSSMFPNSSGDKIGIHNPSSPHLSIPPPLLPSNTTSHLLPSFFYGFDDVSRHEPNMSTKETQISTTHLHPALFEDSRYWVCNQDPGRLPEEGIDCPRRGGTLLKARNHSPCGPGPSCHLHCRRRTGDNGLEEPDGCAECQNLLQTQERLCPTSTDRKQALHYLGKSRDGWSILGKSKKASPAGPVLSQNLEQDHTNERDLDNHTA